jgi:hypothetical protein
MSNTDMYFDFTYYINLYPDLRQNGINTYETALNHWKTYGKKQERICNKIFHLMNNFEPDSSLVKQYFDWEYYINKYPDININNDITKYRALYHWQYHGRNEGRICNKLFEPDNNSEMNNILFCILHHSKSNKDTELLEQCIQSVRRFYTHNDILIIKTSTSIIPDSFSKYNIKIVNKENDNSFYIGAYKEVIKMPHKHYILLHDSIFLLKKLTSEVLYKRFYILWYFNGPFDFPEELYKQYYSCCNLNEDLKAKMNDLYYNKFAVEWLGVFGACAGGQISYLKQILEAIDCNDTNNKLFYGPGMAIIFERYIGLIAKTLDIYDTFTTSPALNGNCHDTYLLLNTYTSIDDVYKKAKEHNYNGYFWKIHINRVQTHNEN